MSRCLMAPTPPSTIVGDSLHAGEDRGDERAAEHSDGRAAAVSTRRPALPSTLGLMDDFLLGDRGGLTMADVRDDPLRRLVLTIEMEQTVERVSRCSGMGGRPVR